ncbi:MAG: hypothetical protein NVS9B4_14770 [Candidatus Acidiferrum sp.]
MVAVPVVFLSELAVAVMVMVTGVAGTLEGAVKVTVVLCTLESTPVVASQSFGAEVVVVPVEDVVLVVN